MFAPVLVSSRRRAVWLGINLLTAFLAAWVIGQFQATLSQLVALAVLMPIVASMGGIAGSQTLTLVIRGLALGQVQKGNIRILLNREIGVSILNGALWAVVIALLAVAFWGSARNRIEQRPWLLKWALWSIPLPWIAAEMGWFVAEYGRQPWTIHGVLPTHLSTSMVSAGDVALSLTGFIVFYTLLLVAELYLMFKYARLGPASLGTGRYALEQPGAALAAQGA